MHVTVAGVCTKNTNTNKNAWTAVKEDWSEMFLYGCAAHELHLYILRIFLPQPKPKRTAQRLIQQQL
jgi:hypothetical protein